jgi:hypothetical protein
LYYYIYFDSADFGIKPAPNYASNLTFITYSTSIFGVNNSKLDLRVHTDPNINHTSGMYFAQFRESGDIIFNSGSANTIEFIRYNDTSNSRYVGYDFMNNFQVENEGPIRITVKQQGDEKALGHLDNARELLEHVNELLEFLRLEAAPAPPPVVTPAPALGVSTPVLMFMFFVIAALGGAVVYLTRDRISGVLRVAGTPAIKKPKARARRISPGDMARADSLRDEIRNAERLLKTMREQNDMGLITDSTYNELKKRNEQKVKEAQSKLKKLGV